MDILQLRYFFDSANYLSIAKTAEKYKVPPSSVSASIKRLEKELGGKLFDRLPNRIALNEKGKLMRDSLAKIFDEMDNMLSAVSEAADDGKEIKILVKAVRALVTDCIIKYKTKYANTRFKLVADFEELALDDYDIIIDNDLEGYSGYESILLGKQRILLYAAPDSPLASGRLFLHQFAKEPFVVMSRRGNHGKLLCEACERVGFTPNIVAQVNDSACFRKIISSGIAIGVSGAFLQDKGNPIALRPLNVADFNPEQTICIYYKKENNHGNTARFISFLQAEANERKTNHQSYLL